MSLYVRMTDNFLSGWGVAQNKVNVLVIECADSYQAECILKAAQDRPEMKRAQICLNKPKARRGVLYTFRQFTDMRGAWKSYYREAQS